MLAKLASATPSRRADQVEDADRGPVPGERRLGDRLAVDLAALGEHRAERRVGLALGGGARLAAERGAGGVGLDAAVPGAVALTGQAVHRDHDVAELGARPRSPPGRSRRRGSGRRRCRCRSSASRRCRRRGRRRRGARRGPRRWRRCRRRSAARSARRPASRIGRFSIGRLTAEIATPRSWSIVAGIPRPTAATPGRARRASLDLAHEQLHQLLLGLPGRGLAALQVDLRVGVEDAEQHLRAAQIHAYRLGGTHRWRQATAGIAMISTPFMADNGEQQPNGPPEYKVFRSRRGIFSRFRKPDVLEPARPPRKLSPSDRRRRAARRFGRPSPAAGHPTASGSLKWVGIAAAGLDRAQLPRLRGLRPAAGLQALRRSEGSAARQPLACWPARRRSSCSAPTRGHRTPRSRGCAPTRRSASNSRRTATPPTAAAKRANSAPTR